MSIYSLQFSDDLIDFDDVIAVQARCRVRWDPSQSSQISKQIVYRIR